jgi:hypothetical protein
MYSRPEFPVATGRLAILGEEPKDSVRIRKDQHAEFGKAEPREGHDFIGCGNTHERVQ